MRLTALALGATLSATVGAQEYEIPTQFFSPTTVFAAQVQLPQLTGENIADSIEAVVDFAALRRHLSPEDADRMETRRDEILQMANAMGAVPQGLVYFGVPHLTFFGFADAAVGVDGLQMFGMIPIPAGVDPADVQSGLSTLAPGLPNTHVLDQYNDAGEQVDQWLVANATGGEMPPETNWSPQRQERFGEAAETLGTDDALLWVFVPTLELHDEAMAALDAQAQGGDLSARSIAMRAEARTVTEVLTRAHWVGGTVRLGSNFRIAARAELREPGHVSQLRSSWDVLSGVALAAAEEKDRERQERDQPPLTFSHAQLAQATLDMLQPQWGERSVFVDMTTGELREFLVIFTVSMVEGLAEMLGELMAGTTNPAVE